MTFAFATADNIRFGRGTVEEAGDFAAELGAAALIVTGSQPDRHSATVARIQQSGLSTETFKVESEPTVEIIEEGVTAARDSGANIVIAIGGGSALDAGKAISALAPNEGPIVDYLEVIGAGERLKNDPLPFIAIPTTAGTGAEVTRNAVIGAPEHRVKVSLRDPRMLPSVSIVDPDLTAGLPAGVTATSGMDALTHLIEPFVSVMANPLVDGLCRAGIPRAARALARLNGATPDPEAREDLMFASLLGGLALSNAKLGAIHGFAGVIGGRSNAPHGAICAALLPSVTLANISALLELGEDHPMLEKYAELADLLTGDGGCVPAEAVDWAWNVCNRLSIPTLSEIGVEASDLSAIAEAAAVSSSMKGNPVQFTKAELVRILESAM